MGRLRLPAGCPAAAIPRPVDGAETYCSRRGEVCSRLATLSARRATPRAKPGLRENSTACCRQTALGCASDRLRGRSRRRCGGSATLLSRVSRFPGASVENDGKARGDQRSTRNSGLALVGRETETAEIVRRVGADRSHSDVLILTGDPGAGKSTLLGIAAGSARSAGGRVLRAVGSESEAHLGFAGLHQMLRPVLGEAEGLPSRQRAALRAVLGLDECAETPDAMVVGLAVLTLLSDLA
ncbi:MAG: ATP-binding protein, partial [Streptomyces sp.]|nr:ATP-binding protein [Streptomyces sp.]